VSQEKCTGKMVRVCESNASWKLGQRERVEKQKQRGRGWKTEETNKKRREEVADL